MLDSRLWRNDGLGVGGVLVSVCAWMTVLAAMVVGFPFVLR